MYLYPSFRKLKKYELILPKNIIRNYCVLVNYKNYIYVMDVILVIVKIKI